MGADPDDAFLLGCRGGEKNYMRYCNPRLDALEGKAASEPDLQQRMALYETIDRIVARDVPIVYLFNPTYIYAYDARLHGFQPNGFVPTWNAYDWRLQ
jgi:peptide/nickel transport system substrate-binding protein